MIGNINPVAVPANITDNFDFDESKVRSGCL